MDFGDILDQWDQLKRSAARAAKANRGGGLAPAAAASGPPDPAESPARRALESWIDSHELDDKDSDAPPGDEEIRARRRARARRLEAMAPQAKLDLHGLGVQAAEFALASFLEDSGRKGLEKVLVVTGKGNHSAEGPVLVGVARRVIESSPWAGRFGPAEKAQGGSGALWVAIRPRIGLEEGEDRD